MWRCVQENRRLFESHSAQRPYIPRIKMTSYKQLTLSTFRGPSAAKRSRTSSPSGDTISNDVIRASESSSLDIDVASSGQFLSSSSADSSQSHVPRTSLPSLHDVGVIINDATHLSDAELIVRPYVPPLNYSFSMHIEHNKQRSFQRSWLSKYPWLVYSRERDGGLCLAYSFFLQRLL